MRGANLPGDAAGTPGSITEIKFASLNLATSELRAIDIQADYVSTSNVGNFRFYAIGTHTDELSRRVLPGEDPIDRADHADGPLKWRANFGVDWDMGSWKAGWNAQYFNSYQVCASYLSQFACEQQQTWQGSDRIPSQTYHDVYLRYAFATTSGVLADTSVSVGVQTFSTKRARPSLAALPIAPAQPRSSIRDCGDSR